jgi:hypothetical protein
MREDVKCVCCGTFITKNHLDRHQRSKKCINAWIQRSNNTLDLYKYSKPVRISYDENGEEVINE